MSPEEFVTAWLAVPVLPANTDEVPEQRFVRPDDNTLAELRLTPEDTAFLRRAGLPASAAPYVSFDELGQGCPRIYEVWPPQQDWSEEQRARLRRYRWIGSDGSGNPICFDAERQEIVSLDHDTGFEDVSFVNSGFCQLAACLLAYRELVAETRLLGGPDAYLAGNIRPESRHRASEAILAADPRAWEEDCFWWWALKDE